MIAARDTRDFAPITVVVVGTVASSVDGVGIVRVVTLQPVPELEFVLLLLLFRRQVERADAAVLTVQVAIGDRPINVLATRTRKSLSTQARTTELAARHGKTELGNKALKWVFSEDRQNAHQQKRQSQCYYSRIFGITFSTIQTVIGIIGIVAVHGRIDFDIIGIVRNDLFAVLARIRLSRLLIVSVGTITIQLFVPVVIG